MGDKKGKEAPKGDAKPVIKQEVPPPPTVNSSEYTALLRNKPFTEFNKYPAAFYDTLKTQTFESAAPFHDKPLRESYEEILNEFNAAAPGDLVRNPTQAIIDFGQYIRANINPEVFKFIANCWPPTIPANGSDLYCLFLIKLLHKAKQPQEMLQWIAQMIFPINYTKPNPNPHLAICRCKKGKKPGFWAVLDQNKIFYIFTFKGNDQQEVFNVKPHKFQVGKDQISIEVMNDKGKALWKFIPEDPAQIQLWEHVLETPAPMIQFQTSFKTPAPDQFYQALYATVMNADSHILRALLSPQISQPDTPVTRRVVESFAHVYNYGGKMNVLIEQVLLYDLTHLTCTLNEYISKPSHAKNLILFIVKYYSTPYLKNFITKLATFIDETGISGLGTPEVNVEGVEKLVNNVVKFIAHSYYLIPDQIRQAFNMLRTYLSLIANNTLSIYQFISEIFLKDFLYSILLDIKKFAPSVQHPEYFPPLARLLYVIFSFGNLDGEFAPLEKLEKRLFKKLYPLLLEFAITISDHPDNEVDWIAPKADPLARAIEDIAKAITYNPQKFSMCLQDVYTVDHGQSLLGSNYAGMLIQYFIHLYDSTPVAVEGPEEKPMHHKLIKADQFNKEELKDKKIRKVVKYDKNEAAAPGSPDKPKKYYKKVTKKVPRNQVV